MTTEYPQDLQDVIKFHGHICPGLAIGYRAAKAAQERLEVPRPEDEELLAIVESDGCGIDAVQALLGCTLGKGNLIYRDHGKQVYTLISRERGRAVRVAAKPGLFDRTPEQEAVFQKYLNGKASAEEEQTFWTFQKERVKHLMEAKLEDLFRITDVSPEVPEKARIFRSLICEYCQEPVMEPRARVRDGKVACICCSEDYGRGW
ncbi:MAG: FmdE family protein [Desulforhabdus sp.]|jgi:formylmethanofuran dehydrogenase subunit E|nr:FmdE family protein [Desulforhabdus sp.]